MNKVSIILPIYNVSQYLRECLDSVIGQTLQDIEIICVNDGSTDNCLDIIQEYAAKDPRIVVITGPNGGYGKAMNKGLNRATGEYIGIVEPDDYVIPEMFAELYAAAQKHNLDMVKANFYRFTRNEQGEETLHLNLLDGTKQRYGELLCPAEDPSCLYFTMNTWCGIYRREFLNQYHIRHNETPGASFQDNGFFFQTFAFAKRAMILNKPYYCNRRDNPNSSVKSKDKVYCMNVEYDFIRDILMKDRGLWERFKYMYWWKRYSNFWFNYNRIDESYRQAYMQRTQMEYRRAIQLGQMRREEFTKEEWKCVQQIISGTDRVIDRILSVRIIGRITPYIPRPIKQGVIHCLELLTKLIPKIQQ